MDTAGSTFTRDNYLLYCDRLAKKDSRLASIIEQYGYPAMWEREPDFEGLVTIILEQQVSLASARSVLKKLRKKTAAITPEIIFGMDDIVFQDCGFSRQKKRYVKTLAHEILNKGFSLIDLVRQPDEAVRNILIAITGIGSWTCDVFLLLCLNRMDIFPATDLALVTSMKENRIVPQTATTVEIENRAGEFKPCRSILAMILWHAYIKKRGMVIP